MKQVSELTQTASGRVRSKLLFCFERENVNPSNYWQASKNQSHEPRQYLLIQTSHSKLQKKGKSKQSRESNPRSNQQAGNNQNYRPH